MSKMWQFCLGFFFLLILKEDYASEKCLNKHFALRTHWFTLSFHLGWLKKIKTNSWLILIPSNGVPTQHAGQVALQHLLLPTAADPLGWYNNWWPIEVENPNQSGLISKVQMIHFISSLKTKTKMSTSNEKLNNYSQLQLEMVCK